MHAQNELERVPSMSWNWFRIRKKKIIVINSLIVYTTKNKVLAAIPVKNVKFSQLFAHYVEKKPRFLSNRLRIDLFIAENAMYPPTRNNI